MEISVGDTLPPTIRRGYLRAELDCIQVHASGLPCMD